MNWVHRCLIVPASQVEFARQLPAAIAGSSGEGMWVTPLSPTGQRPATHFISAGSIDQQFADLLPLTRYLSDSAPIHVPGQAAITAQLATQAGLEVKPEQVQALFDASDASNQSWQNAIARLGLMLVAEVIK